MWGETRGRGAPFMASMSPSVRSKFGTLGKRERRRRGFLFSSTGTSLGIFHPLFGGQKMKEIEEVELERGQEEGGDCADEASVLPQLPAAQTLSPPFLLTIHIRTFRPNLFSIF